MIKQDARARYAVLKDSAETACVSRRRYDGSGAELDGGVARSAGLSKQPKPPDAWPSGSEAASSKQSSEGRAPEGSVVPATARPKAPKRSAGWCAGVEGIS